MPMMPVVRLFVLCCLSGLLPALPAQDPVNEAEWQKFAGKPEALAPVPGFATPGGYLNLGDRLVAFPAGGLAIDLPLDATLPGGRAIKAALLPTRALWIDLDGDGKADSAEKFSPTPTGYGPITLPLKYKNDTQAPYSFHLVATATPDTFRLVTGQMIRYTLVWKRHQSTILLIDQNNNGRYDEPGKDVLLIDGRPGTFLAKTITLGTDADSVAEVVVYPDGTRLELRDYTGPTGVLDMISGYKPAQNGITVCYIAVDGELARPGFSQACPRIRVPVGNYQYLSATLQRAKEQVRVDKGGLLPVAVEKDKTVSLTWGGTVELKYGFRRDGENLVFDSLRFVGKEHQERYLPQPPQTLLLQFRAEEYLPSVAGWPASGVPLSFGNVEIDPAGDPREAPYKPVLIKHKGRHMLMVLQLSYPSGIMGVVEVHDKLEFTPQEEKK
ncbi:MAG TPA: hypothetical protein VL860_09625 [Planctomycetota bacterium]|nr:hypothetical protein [Planctomycetota bacterium]